MRRWRNDFKRNGPLSVPPASEGRNPWCTHSCHKVRHPPAQGRDPRGGSANGVLSEVEQEMSEIWRMIGLPLAYYALGRQADSDQALSALIAKYGKDAAFNIAYVYRGEADKAFEWLNKEFEYSGPGIFAELPTETLFAKIHSDPRWLPFLRRFGKAPVQLAKIEFEVTVPREWQTQGAATP